MFFREHTECSFVLTRREIQTGSRVNIVFCEQCTVCGRSSNFIAIGSLSQKQRDKAVPFDDGPRDAWSARISEYYDQQRESALQEAEKLQKERYEYIMKLYHDHVVLKSEKWKELRQLVMKRCGGICEGCGKEPAVQVHHATYKHLGNEFLFELLGLCDKCHNRFHIPYKFMGLDKDDDDAA